MNRDMLTYRHPRTLVDAFGCDARSAQAIHRYKRPLSERVADYITAVVMAGGLLLLALYGLGAL